jgi:hypothetical protein
MTPTQEARDLVWLVLNASPRSNMDDLARGVQAIIDAAEERGKRMALETAAKRVESHMADCLEDRDIQRRWKQIKATNDIYATAIRQIDPASLGAE